MKRACGNWYANVCYKIAAPERPDVGPATGVDMNARQVAASDCTILAAPDTSRLKAKIRRHQRTLARRKRGSLARITGSPWHGATDGTAPRARSLTAPGRSWSRRCGRRR